MRSARALALAMALPLPVTAQDIPWRLEFRVGNDVLAAEPADIYTAEAYLDANGPLAYVLMTDAFGEAFADFTEAHIGETLVVGLCRRVLMRPTVRGRVSGGQAVISAENMETAETYAAILRSEMGCEALDR